MTQRYFACLAGAMLFASGALNAQQPASPDTLQEKVLKDLTVQGHRAAFQAIAPLPDLHQTYLLAGKKTEVVRMDATPANVAEKTGRQVFAKIPGAFVYDMDGSGNQINLATRGLDPHRSWELNVRQNGVMANSDIYGYPASHYSPPLEAIKRIELVRGTAALQYGPAFGGMINYVTRQPDTTRAVGFENASSIGSFGLLSTYNALGGKSGRLVWQAYAYRRSSKGYRQNARSDFEAQFVSATWHFSPKMSLKAEIGRSAYVFQVPGPLTDSMMRDYPRQATRSRNYFNPDIWLPSLTWDFAINKHTDFQIIASAVRGARSSVQFLGLADRVDAIDPATGQYKPRQVDIDNFHSYTSEARLSHRYALGRLRSTVVGGLRFIHNDLHRRQLGQGTTGIDFDLSLTNPDWGRDLHFKTLNAAVFVENLLQVTPQLSVSPGIRYEHGLTRMSGSIRYLAPERVPTEIAHRFPLLGCSFEYKSHADWRVYGGFSQAYRPVIFADVIPPNELERTDADLRDARGYNAEIGLRGDFFEKIKVNATFFRVQYNDRVGGQVLSDPATGQVYTLKTNVGDSRTDGLECYLEYTPLRRNSAYLSVFTATAYMDGRYTSGMLAVGSSNENLRGKRLETVPRWTSRNGLQGSWRKWNAALQHSFVSETYSDPLNTQSPSPNGARGIVPAYQIWDAHLGWRASQQLQFRLSVNNLTNAHYFTKRPTGYPGQGVWPSDGRGVVLTMRVRV
jgi:Fe(3+) dicitrate transport protein